MSPEVLAVIVAGIAPTLEALHTLQGGDTKATIAASRKALRAALAVQRARDRQAIKRKQRRG